MADETLSGIVTLSQVTQVAYQLRNISIGCIAFGRSNEKYKPHYFHHLIFFFSYKEIFQSSFSNLRLYIYIYILVMILNKHSVSLQLLRKLI